MTLSTEQTEQHSLRACTATAPSQDAELPTFQQFARWFVAAIKIRAAVLEYVKLPPCGSHCAPHLPPRRAPAAPKHKLLRVPYASRRTHARRRREGREEGHSLAAFSAVADRRTDRRAPHRGAMALHRAAAAFPARRVRSARVAPRAAAASGGWPAPRDRLPEPEGARASKSDPPLLPRA